MLYDGSTTSTVGLKNKYLGSLLAMAKESGVALEVGRDRPDAFKEVGSTALSSEQSLRFNGTAFGVVVPWMMTYRPAGVSLRLVPLSRKGGICLYGDYVSRSMYAGEHWELNEHPLLNGAPGFQPLGSSRISTAQSTPALRTETQGPCETLPTGYLLYVSAVTDNAYQMYSAGLDSYKSGLAQLLSKAFPSSSGCEMGGSQICDLGVALAPAQNESDPMMLSYSHLYVPSNRLAEVVSFAMDNHIAAKVYYDVDLRLVPVRPGNSCLEEGYVQDTFKTGPDWRLNGNALTAARLE